jgi:chemotaxis protein methyltransferase CheR
MTAPVLTQPDYEFVRGFVRDRAAIVLEGDKQYLVEARLTPLATKAGLGGVGQLIAKVRNEQHGPLAARVVEAMTTNETSWFRDVAPFEAFKSTVLPGIVQARQATRRINIWCAAASSGQEPYSLAMIIEKAFPQLAGWEIKLWACDISDAMVERIKAGRYSQLEVNRGLPATYLSCFRRSGLEFEIDERFRKQVHPFTMNLATHWPGWLPKFDIVFIRNVLIYFDVPTKREIFRKVRTHLATDGVMFLGGAESTLNLDDAFERVPMAQASCYRLKAR